MNLTRIRPRAVWDAARGAALTMGGFAALTAAAWTVHLTAGLATLGVSLLVLEYLSGPEGGAR